MPGRSASLYVPITLRKARPTCGASAMAVWLPGSTSPARSCTTPVARAWKNSSPAASEAKVASSPAAAGSEAGQQAEDEEADRSEEHTSELQSLMRISYAVFCLKKKINHTII